MEPDPVLGHPLAAPDGDALPEAWRVRVGLFEGPLDLLLHLVRVNEVDVTDIPILEIARQYDAYLDLMRELNLEIAGEYLVMAATLVHIKSRMLLPQETSAEEGEAEDPRAELVQQILEHQRFKQAAENLQALDSVRGLIWTRDGIVPREFAGEEMLAVDLYDLISAFRKLLGRLDEEARLRLVREDVSVPDKIAWLTDLLEQRPSLGFDELIRALPTLMDRIATFLALLEMIRLQMVLVFQTRLLSEIRIARRPDPVDAGGTGPERSTGEGGER